MNDYLKTFLTFLSTSQQNAISKAIDYLNFMPKTPNTGPPPLDYKKHYRPVPSTPVGL